MKINKNKNGTKLTFEIAGRVDTSTAPQLESAIKEEISGVKELVFDMDKVEYISSAGLRVLLSSQKTMNNQGTMKLINVNDEIMEIFEVTGFTDILTIK